MTPQVQRMTMRHFAYFDQATGCYIREARGMVPLPNIDPRLPKEQRTQLLNRWATGVSQPAGGEVALDVTQFNHPLGSFRWSKFDVIDFRLDFVEMHTFVEVDLERRRIANTVKSTRPVLSYGDRLVFDVTDTPLQMMEAERLVALPEPLNDPLVVGVIERVPAMRK